MTTRLGKSVAWIAFGALVAATTARAEDEAPKVGDKAPDFTLKGTDGKSYSLSDFEGKKPVVLAWFPKADTPGCTAECKSFREASKDLKGLDVAYFTASVDTVDDNKAFAEKLGLDYPILSDPDKDTARAYGVLGSRGVAQRWTFYIDKDGTIRKIDKEIKAAQAGSDVARTIHELGLASR